jgi:outer membrane protein assembly factor BamB
MIRIRTGSAWRHDPALREALRRDRGPGRAAVARAVVDALALEVDGVDIAAGLAEGPLLPALEALLRAVARVVGGASHATVPFPDGEVELLLRRRGRTALLSVVAVSRPSRVIARDVEVELDALAAAALDASAALCRELAELFPGGGDREARPLRAAARALRRTEVAAPPRPQIARRPRAPRRSPRGAPVSCHVELEDDDGLVEAYEGGRADLGSLLGPGHVSLRAADGRELAALPGLPFLVARDLGPAAEAILRAVRSGEARAQVALGRPRQGAAILLDVDLAGARVSGPGAGTVPCPPLALARALVVAQAELCRALRARNPRQSENSWVADLERDAAGRLAEIDELAEGDRAAAAPADARVPSPPRVPQHPLGPGRLRRLSFLPTFRLDAGAPAGDGLFGAGRAVLVAGAAATAAIERSTGTLLWRAGGAGFAAAVGGLLLCARPGELAALAIRSGRPAWSRSLAGDLPSAAVALPRGPWVIVEGGTALALDPATGRTLWRFAPPGAGRLAPAAFGGVLAVAADTGHVYGLDATGRTLWRTRAPGPVLRPPLAAGGLCLALAAADQGMVLLALEPATGARAWEARLDVSGAVAAAAWGLAIAVAGTVAGDPLVAVLDRRGRTAWSVAPGLEGALSATPAGPLLVVRDARGALAGLGRDGAVRWARPAPAGAAAPRGPAAASRGTLVTASGSGLEALDVRTGELLAAIPGPAPVRLAVDAALAVVALDADGLAAGWRLGTHLSLV